MKKKIMLIDDEEGILEIMQSYFEMTGYQVFCAKNGREALQKLFMEPDIILLDINMPDFDGISLCSRIRDYVDCPILFLTARSETADKIKGFAAGGDDYIVKPFDLEELGARIEAHLRREKRNQNRSELRFFDDLTIDYTKRQVTLGDKSVVLSKKEFDIVQLLSTHPGQVFHRERIYEIVWGLEGAGSSDTIMEHIRKIRMKLAAVSEHNYIETVWGVGYKWNG